MIFRENILPYAFVRLLACICVRRRRFGSNMQGKWYEAIFAAALQAAVC